MESRRDFTAAITSSRCIRRLSLGSSDMKMAPARRRPAPLRLCVGMVTGVIRGGAVRRDGGAVAVHGRGWGPHSGERFEHGVGAMGERRPVQGTKVVIQPLGGAALRSTNCQNVGA